MRRSGARWALAIAAGLLLAGAPQLVSAAGRPGASTSPLYYLALGDSLAQGVQVVNGTANVTNQGYVDDLFQTLHEDAPNLQLVKLGCPGETTGTMISGGCPYFTYPAGSQLAQAVEFLRAHRNRVALVTIDIGANNVDGCFSATGISLSCFYRGLADVGSQLPLILRQLRGAAGPRVPIVGMNYYDPFLATYLETGGQAGAIESVGLGDLLNTVLGAVFAFNGDEVANVQATFKTNDFAPSSDPSVPTNVALICAWTYMCTYQNIHANALGYQEIAGAFEELPQIQRLRE